MNTTPRKTLLATGIAVLAIGAGATTAPTTQPAQTAATLALAQHTADATEARDPRTAAINYLAHEAHLTTELATARYDAQDGLAAKARAFRSALGQRAAGDWIDVARGEVHAGVLNDADAAAASEASIIAHKVSYSTADLKRVNELLAQSHATPAGGSRDIDAETNHVILDIPQGSSADNILDKAHITAEDRKKISVRTHPVEQNAKRTGLLGGDGIRFDTNGTGAQCSAGIMVTWGGSHYILTAGHCAQNGTIVYRDNLEQNTYGSNRIGHVEERQYGYSSDYELIYIDSSYAWKPGGGRLIGTTDGNHWYNGYVTDSGWLTTGGLVCFNGAVSGWRCGKFLNDDSSIHSGDVETNGLWSVDTQAAKGDSGGAAIWYDQAVGTVVGQNANGKLVLQPIKNVIGTHNGMDVLKGSW